MAFVPNAYAAKANLEFETEGLTWSFNLWFAHATTQDATSVSILAYALSDWVTAVMLPLFVQVTFFNGVTVYSMASTTAPKATVPKTPHVPGLVAQAPCPLNAALVVTFDAGGRGRTSRNRIYITGLPESQITSSEWNLTVQNDVKNAFTALRETFLLPLLYTQAVASSYVDGAARSQILLQPVVSTIPKQLTGTQRKRIRKT